MMSFVKSLKYMVARCRFVLHSSMLFIYIYTHIIRGGVHVNYCFDKTLKIFLHTLTKIKNKTWMNYYQYYTRDNVRNMKPQLLYADNEYSSCENIYIFFLWNIKNSNLGSSLRLECRVLLTDNELIKCLEYS